MNASADAAVIPSAAKRERPLARSWSWIDDRLNPILVKEVRQALRGRYFRNLFWFTIVAATGISVLRILTAENGRIGSLGPDFFVANYAVMAIAINAFVPFWAFQSMSSEWDENTYDLLVISNLRPTQLLLGKALAATVQTLLFFSAFAPFLVSTFLMGGVDLVSIVCVLAGAVVVSPTLSMIALSAASFGRSRLMRAILAIGVIGVLLFLGGMTILAGTAMIEQPEFLRRGEFTVALCVFASIVPLIATLALAVGCARLAHEQENRSTFLRAVVTLISLVSLGWGIYGFSLGSSRHEPEWFEVMAGTSMMVGIIPFLFFVTETEPLGRRVAKQVPKSKLGALLALPFLPGGARGMWLYILIAGATILGVAVDLELSGTVVSGTRASIGCLGFTLSRAGVFVATTFAYGFVVIGLISGIASFHIRSLRGRTGVRLAIPLAVIAMVVGPALFGLVFDIHRWTQFEHPLNPFWVLIRIGGSSDGTANVPGILLLALGVVVTLCVNVPRLMRSISDTLRASRARREREMLVPSEARDAEAAS